jgi:cell division protein FtsB
MSETKETKIARKSVLIALGIICIVLASSLVGTLVYYASLVNDKDSAISALNSQISQLTSNVTNLQNQATSLQTQVNELLNSTVQSSLYYDEFGSVSIMSRSYNFSPPVSMYTALRTALESDGWNESSLINDTVRVSLDYWEFIYSPISSGIQWLHAVTQPVKDYSPVEINSTYGNSWSTTVYRYIWTIYVNENPFVNLVSVWQWHPLALYLVDAATGEIIPHGPIF